LFLQEFIIIIKTNSSLANFRRQNTFCRRDLPTNLFGGITTSIKINEQIAFLRKQKNITQEELAQALGVTNQSVSKWENGACCPDIALLPEIAAYFGVTTDALLGYKPADSLGDVYLKIKALFQESPAEESFALAFKLGFILHEGAVSRGYKGFVPWDTSRDRIAENGLGQWGFSACSEPEGVSVMKGNTILIANGKIERPVSAAELRDIHSFLQTFENKDTLKVIFGLCELTAKDYSVYITVKELAEACKLPVEDVEHALGELPTQIGTAKDGSEGYRIEGRYMHIPTVLRLLTA